MSALGSLFFVAALLFSIGLHELGHLATAKRFGMKVHQYFIGFGPKLWSTFRGETEYGVKALPLGGFVRIAGMNPFEEVSEEDRDRVFKAKKPYQQGIVLAAGSFTHFVLGLLILILVYTMSSFPQPTTTVDEVSMDAPSAAAGFKAGDVILRVEGVDTPTWEAVTSELRKHPGERVNVRVIRGGERRTLQPTLLARHPDSGAEGGFLGVRPTTEDVTLGVGQAFGDFFRIIPASVTGFLGLFSPGSLSELWGKLIGSTPRTAEDPTTLIGLTGTAGSLAAEGQLASLFFLIAYFNVFIGVVNLLPLLPLDGGHLAVLAYEKVTRRVVDMRRLIPLTATVIGVFGVLFLLLLTLDVTRPLPSL